MVYNDLFINTKNWKHKCPLIGEWINGTTIQLSTLKLKGLNIDTCKNMDEYQM